MNKYHIEYNRKSLSVDEVLQIFKSNDNIVMGSAAEEPLGIMEQFHTIHNRVENVTVWQTLGVGYTKYIGDSDMKGHIKTNSFFYGPVTRPAHSTGNVSFFPCDLHSIWNRLLYNNKPNIFIGVCTPMDENGFVRMPMSLIYEKEAIETADIVIMEVNPYLPLVHGETEVHISDIDYFVEIDRPITAIPDMPSTEIQNKIGEFIAELVNDGDTIQLGIGGIPDAAARSLRHKKDLGIHSEMIGSSIAELFEAGAITGSKKSLHKGKIIGTFILGSQKLYDFVNDNPSVHLMKGSYVNDPRIIALNDNMVSVQTALQIDITGQVCSESIGHRHYSGPGGSLDFVLGTTHSKGGKAIVAVESTKKNGQISSIQTMLTPGSIGTLPRQSIDFVVTEYGVAQLKGCTIKQRVENLINIAHPNFREELRKDAIAKQIW